MSAHVGRALLPTRLRVQDWRRQDYRRLRPKRRNQFGRGRAAPLPGPRVPTALTNSRWAKGPSTPTKGVRRPAPNQIVFSLGIARRFARNTLSGLVTGHYDFVI